ncbi:uncharacterized protein Z520_08037 [Fonsecaea multimorphosa CBS 102226]|uniref:Uncharacterized protein n=1 Tax=Fonsecaea multimorphosa CBS 102226 TaxID=1442371 RepID=A0A0D2K050_9EURO|nr:uncharacterized protein Z520_08037 [Fonsecaea multimorphosa CBS 102226]KIX96259.1 hypothetical protein Z520_08037 [Fonsecaea multimorphosa CBS 102226]OAL21922.1 hypothetical protein AYO22_07519 [Fonsecaea multimorphosa]
MANTAKLMTKCRMSPLDFLEYCIEEYNINDGELVLPQNASQQPRRRVLSILLRCRGMAGLSSVCLPTCGLDGQLAPRCIVGSDQDERIKEILSDLEGCTRDVLFYPAIIIGFTLTRSLDLDANLVGYQLEPDVIALSSRLDIANEGLRRYLESRGLYREPDQDYSALTVDLYMLQHFLSDLYHSHHANIVLVRKLKSIFKLYHDATRSRTIFECVDDLLCRLELQKGSLDHCARITQHQSAVLFNLINQRDSRLNFSVARSSRQIAAASKRDSSAMKTISILTLVFLPGTFVSSVFSTTIFDFTAEAEPGYGRVSKAWWIYLLCSLLLTLITVGVWAVWMVWRLNKAIHEERREMEELREHEHEARPYGSRAPPTRRRSREYRDSTSVRAAGNGSHRNSESGSRRSSRISLSRTNRTGRTRSPRSNISLHSLRDPGLDSARANVMSGSNQTTDGGLGGSLQRPGSGA